MKISIDTVAQIYPSCSAIIRVFTINALLPYETGIVILLSIVIDVEYNGKLSTWVINTLCITYVDNFLQQVI